MSETHQDTGRIARRFNHDLLVETADQEAAARQWPALAHVLINPELIREFMPHETRATMLKRSVHIVGSIAVLMMLVALLGYATELWLARSDRGSIPYLALFSEINAIAALLLALLASRYGPLRRRWLKHRFITEVLRQWHFRRLLDGQSIAPDRDARDQVFRGRDADLSALMTRVAGAVGAKMDELSELRRDPLGRIPRTSLPQNADARGQLLDAYRVLRVDHQRDFAMYKLSADDDTFAGLPLLALANLTEMLAGTTLVLALACAIARLFMALPWAPVAAVSLALTGVAVRAWRDGFALESERERYQELLHVLELLTARWEDADSDEQRFRVAEEVERAALEELRSFIRPHEQAQFLF